MNNCGLLISWCTKLNKKIASVSIIAIMTVVLFGTFAVYRALAQGPLTVNAAIFSGLSPIPKQVTNDLDIVYVAVMAGASGGTGPYTIEVWIRQQPDPYQRWAIFEQPATGGGGIPILWSTNAPTTSDQRFVNIFVRVTDSTAAVEFEEFTILLPMSSPTA